jgi:hypothetical protein
MGSLSLPIPAEERAAQPRGNVATAQEVLLVASFGVRTAVDYAAHASRTGDRHVALVADEGVRRRVEAATIRAYSLEDVTRAAEKKARGIVRFSGVLGGRVAALIVFLNPRLTERDRRLLDDLLFLAGDWQTDFVGVVSTFRVHLGDQAAMETENHVLTRLKGLGARTVVFRPGHLLCRNSPVRGHLRRLGFCYPLVPERLRSCCIDGDELFAAIECEREKGDGHLFGGYRLYTLVGSNRPWRDLLARHGATGLWRACLTAVCAILALLCVGHLAGLVIDLLARRWPALRRWNFDTLRPGSFQELLALYNPYNYRHLKVVGYNNGVNHFGHRYPGKTIVSTVSCNRVARAGGGLLKADCGATVRKALDFLAGAGQELPVVPNYSYVCLGTSFFVPIHGSAADFSTVADTIRRVVLYDPVRDRLITATRNEAAFREHVYNLHADVLLLRLYLRVKPKSRYDVQRQTLEDPGSDEILRALRDSRATNVEIRKSHASSATVTISRYYTDPGATSSPLLELPRDELGKLWDRLEENPVTSFLMHALTRYFAWHVELFFTAEEFATFWESHPGLPLRKLQLRYIRRDGMPHSPFRDHDCVSVDLFMLRRHRRRFESYLKATFPVVRTNPGKHSK